MKFEIIDTLTGTPCAFCGEPLGDSWSLEEVAPDDWVIICWDCWLTTEVSEGK